MVFKSTCYKVTIAVFCLGALSAPAWADDADELAAAAPVLQATSEPELAPAAGATEAAKAGPLAPFTLKARYIIAWNGITLGRIIADVAEDTGSYRLTVDTKTKGVGAIMSDEKGILETKGIKTAAGDYVPSSFLNAPNKKDEVNDRVTLLYDDKGHIVKRTRAKEDDPAWRPMVSNQDINTATDPLTALFILRRMLYNAPQSQKELAARSYDGLRLANIKIIRIPGARVAVLDKYRDTVGVIIRREPLKGYTPKEIKKYNKGDPELKLYFSNDTAFIPVQASANLSFGSISLTLVDDNAK